MANWFDELAKRSARRSVPSVAEVSSTDGMSRRDVIVKGAAVAGVAWTAPMLMSTRAHAYGVSTCPPDQICGPITEQQFCCPQKVTTSGGTHQCFEDNGVYGCAPPREPGGICVGNNGSGTSSCVDGVFCNGNANSNDCRCTQPNTCGGYGSTCTAGGAKSCSPGFTCSGGFCRPSCSVTDPCPVGLLNVPGVLLCQSNVCQQTCVTKSTCPNGQNCTNGFCA